MMRNPVKIKAVLITALSALAAYAALAGPAQATADLKTGITGATVRPKETMIYHGNGFAVKPANLYNWEYDGYQSGMTGGQMVAGVEGEGTKRFPDGRMTWKRWDMDSAVGVGGLHTYCGTLSKKECKKSPWYGTPRVKVRAYDVESGHFSKTKITLSGSGPKQFMVLKFIGKHLTPAWKVTREVTG